MAHVIWQLTHFKHRIPVDMSEWYCFPNVISCASLSHLQQGSMWNYCMNDEVLKLGLARTAPIAGVLPDSRLYWRLYKRLHRAEVKAERKGRGLWKEDSQWERLSRTVRDNPFFRLVRRLFKRTWRDLWIQGRGRNRILLPSSSDWIKTWRQTTLKRTQMDHSQCQLMHQHKYYQEGHWMFTRLKNSPICHRWVLMSWVTDVLWRH